MRRQLALTAEKHVPRWPRRMNSHGPSAKARLDCGVRADRPSAPRSPAWGQQEWDVIGGSAVRTRVKSFP